MSRLINKVYGQGIEIIRNIMDKETVDGLKQYLSAGYEGDREMSARTVYEWVERLGSLDEALPHIVAIDKYLTAYMGWYLGIEEKIAMPEDCGEWSESELADYEEMIKYTAYESEKDFYFEQQDEEQFQAKTEHSAQWVNVNQLVDQGSLIHTSDNYYGVRFPKTHRIELRNGTLVQQFKTCKPAIWANWQARIVQVIA